MQEQVNHLVLILSLEILQQQQDQEANYLAQGIQQDRQLQALDKQHKLKVMQVLDLFLVEQELAILQQPPQLFQHLELHKSQDKVQELLGLYLEVHSAGQEELLVKLQQIMIKRSLRLLEASGH